LGQVQLAALEQVEQPAWTRDHEVHALGGERLHLLLQVHAAEERHLAHVVVLDHLDQLALNLHGEFARGRDDEALGRGEPLRVVVHVGVRVVEGLELVVQDGDDEPQGLARASLRVEDHVLAQDGIRDAQLLAEGQFGLLQLHQSVYDAFVELLGPLAVRDVHVEVS